jgi:hypothetical protein
MSRTPRSSETRRREPFMPCRDVVVLEWGSYLFSET